MFYRLKKPITLLILTAFMTALCPSSIAEEARRQTVIERTKGYSKGVDLIDVRQSSVKNFKGFAGKGKKVFSDDVKSLYKSGEKDCEGYTHNINSGCENMPCCGKEECSLPCTVNGALAHGDNKTCLEAKQISDIYGRSCCGEKDCYYTDMNFRMDACGGYTHTSNGQNCCGKEDCAAAECQYMTETSGEYGGSGIKGQPCCGYQDCHLKECGGQVADTSISTGEELVCCGAEDCNYQKCDGFISVDSKVDDRTDLECCGEENCHEVECDFHTSTNTPTGVQECCGYEDCHYKECEGKTSVTQPDGTVEICCGRENCKEKIDFSYAPGSYCYPDFVVGRTCKSVGSIFQYDFLSGVTMTAYVALGTVTLWFNGTALTSASSPCANNALCIVRASAYIPASWITSPNDQICYSSNTIFVGSSAWTGDCAHITPHY